MFIKLFNIFSLFFFLSLVWACSPAETTAQPPNVLLIMVDDLNDAISALGGQPRNGYSQAKTPNIDRLMAMGVSFINAHSNNPLCAPSRASMTTGLYPHSSGYYGGLSYNFRENPVLKNARTFVEHFRDNGYQVYGTGKIQHHGSPDTTVWINENGEYGYGIPASFGPYPWDGKDSTVTGHNVPHPGLPEALFIGSQPGNYADVTITSLANVPNYAPDPEKGIPGYTGWRLFKKPFHYENEENRDLMPDERYANWASEKLQQPHEKPFLLCVGFVRPHVPHVAPQKYFDRFPLKDIQLAEILPNDTADCAETLVRDYNYGNGSRDGIENYTQITKIDDGLKRWTQAYLACVAFVDDQIGKVVDALKNSEYADNTIIVLASDHGYHMGQKNWLYKNSLWESSTRIPFVWAGPGITKGAESNQPTSLIDLYPTLVDLCRLPAEPNAATNRKKLDGFSLRPFLEDAANGAWEGPDFALTYVASKAGTVEKAGMMSQPQDHHATLRTKRYRYILCANGEEELYDHQNDPYEWHNLADSVGLLNLKEALKEKLIDFTRVPEASFGKAK